MFWSKSEINEDKWKLSLVTAHWFGYVHENWNRKDCGTSSMILNYQNQRVDFNFNLLAKQNKSDFSILPSVI